MSRWKHTANGENVFRRMHNRRVSTFNLTYLRSGPIVAVNDADFGTLTNTYELVAHSDCAPPDVCGVNIEFCQLKPVSDERQFNRAK